MHHDIMHCGKQNSRDKIQSLPQKLVHTYSLTKNNGM